MNDKKQIIVDETNLFIGKNASKIIDNRYNLVAAFLGPIWFLYRKCYAISFVIFVLQMIVGFTLYIKVGLVAYIYLLGWFFIHLIFGNFLYKRHVHKKIKKINQKHENVNDMIVMGGGTSFLIGTIGTIIYIGLLVIWILSVGLSLNGYRKAGSILFSAPGFEKDQTGILHKEDQGKTCMMQVGPLNETGKNLIYYYYGIAEDFSNLEKEEIHGITWYTNSIKDRKKNFTSIYLYKEEDKIFIAKFYAKETKDYEDCQAEFTKVKKTLKIQ